MHIPTRIRLIAAMVAASVFAFIAGGITLSPSSASNTILSDRDAVRAVCLDRIAANEPLSTEELEWLRLCRDSLEHRDPSPTPSASPTESPSPSPSASPTPSPSASPSPSVSPSPTFSPSPSASPSSSPMPQLGCMTRPSVCGYPDERNTGVPAGTLLTTINGDWHITSGGTYNARDVSGCVYIDAPSTATVTIRNSRIRGNCWFSIRTTGIGGNHAKLIVEDTEIVLASTLQGSYGICCSEYTLTRVWIHGSPNGNAGADCVYFARNVVVQHSFCEVGILPGNPPGNPNATGAHSDGMTSDGGDNVQLIHNTIRNPNQQTSAILISTNSASITNTTIRDGLYAGGGYTVYCGTDGGGVDAGTVFTNNRIARDWNGSSPGYYPNGGFFGFTTHCRASEGVTVSGNVWDDTGAPLPQQ